jgi:hypothetical protein
MVEGELLFALLLLTDLTIVKGEGGYDPSHLVQKFHNTPHLNNHLHRINNDFGITAESRWNNYTDSLVPFPVIIGICGVLLVLIPVGLLISRYWCGCSRCLPTVVNDYLQTMMARSPSRNSNFTQIAFYRHIALVSFIICVFAVSIANQGVLLGEVSRRHSVHHAKDSLGSLKHTFVDLRNQGYGLETAGEVIGDFSSSSSLICCRLTVSLEEDLTLALPTCPEVEEVFNPLDVYQLSVEEYLEIVDPLPSR